MLWCYAGNASGFGRFDGSPNFRSEENVDTETVLSETESETARSSVGFKLIHML